MTLGVRTAADHDPHELEIASSEEGVSAQAGSVVLASGMPTCGRCNTLASQSSAAAVKDAKTGTTKALRYLCSACGNIWTEVVVPLGHDEHRTGVWRNIFVCYTCRGVAARKTRDARPARSVTQPASSNDLTVQLRSGGEVRVSVVADLLRLSDQDYAFLTALRKVVQDYQLPTERR